ncbi:hypothetical protein LTR53_016706 [Teratosphaeriaceae sp. CCFEE 6253]|nr:hypothetical protein LTR53_016706 [Teratosphaeriaceae sp. CCFEE 6253]
MAMRTIIDIPLGEYTAQCTIDVPLAAASAIVNGNTIGMIANDIAATIGRATRVVADGKTGLAAQAEDQRKATDASDTNGETAMFPPGYHDSMKATALRHAYELFKPKNGLAGRAKRRRTDDDEADCFPIHDPSKESDTPSGAQPIHLTIEELDRRKTRCTTWPDDELEGVFSAYAELQCMSLDVLRFVGVGKQLEHGRSAAFHPSPPRSWQSDIADMSMGRVISIPRGDYTATCTIDVSQDATAAVINGKTIEAIADDIAATIDRATRSPTEPSSKEAKGVAKTAVGEDHPSDDEDVYPILDPRLETDTPTGTKPTPEPIQIFIKDVNGTTATYLAQPEVELERLFEAYAARMRVPLETCRFTFAGR